MQSPALLLLILGAVLTGSTTAGNSNTSATQIVSSGDATTPTNSTGGGGGGGGEGRGGRGRGNGWCNGTDVILESIRELAEGVNRLASALESSHSTVKCPTPQYMQLPFRHCSHAYSMGWRDSGVYLVKPDLKEPFEVFCDMETAGGGWTVVQRRVDGSVQFNRTWKDYKDGFGTISERGEFWLGLEKIYRLTGSSQFTQLRIDLVNFDERTAFAHYRSFAVGTADTEYKLVLNGYNDNSTAGDALSQASLVSFSTSDNDNDISLVRVNCAQVNKAGWWFKDSMCGLSNLNGLYLSGHHNKGAKAGIYWHYFGGVYYSLKRSEMKILGKD